MSGIDRIAKERQRQIDGEGWTPEHDQHHQHGQLSKAGAQYAMVAFYARHNKDLRFHPPMDWPWANKWWKPSDDPIRNLEKAGALIAAEIDRLERLETENQQ